MDGEDLAQHLQVYGPLAPEEVVLLINPLCGALEQLRTRGFGLRSLRAEQVFLAGGLTAFNPKLVGPGLTDFPIEQRTSMDGADEVFALGELMFEALTGKPPLSEPHPFADVPLPASADWLRAVINRCLHKTPSARFHSPLEVAHALAGYAPGRRLRDSAPLMLVEESAREKVGDVLGNYQLVQLIGEGTMGRVFLARHVKLGRPVALKILRAEHAKNSALIQRFFQEAKAVNQINHDHIVEIFDFVEEGSPTPTPRVYCVMELLQGKSLANVLLETHPSIARSVKIVRQICEALAAAHQVGVIHRDIKPDNLFIAPRTGDPDYVKVLDFGVAKLITPLADVPTTRTIEGTIVGTPTYMSPEQASGFAADGRTDLYSLGTVLYEMLCGHPPFQGPTFGQLVAQVITYAPPPLPALTPGGERIPADLKSLVLKCLEKAPDDRVPGMVELSVALAPFEAGAVHARSSWPPRQWAAVGSAALVGIALAAGLLHSLVPPTPSEANAFAGHLSRPVEPAASRPVAPRLPLTAVRPLRGSVALHILSSPAGAIVRRADTDEVLGATPLTRDVAREPGEVMLKLELPGHEPAERSVHLSDNVALNITLSPAHRRPAATRAMGKRSVERMSRDAVVDPFAL